MKSNFSILSIVLLLVVIQSAIAGDRSNIRGVGMGRTINAVAQGVDAIGINPADIAVPGKGNFNFNLFPLGLRVNTELFTYKLYKDYFTGVDSVGKRWAKRLEPADMDNILSQIPDLPKTHVDGEVMFFGASYQDSLIGGIAFGSIDHFGVVITLSKDFFRMAAFGLDPAGSQYVFDGTGGSAWWYREYNLSYGRKLPVKIKFLRELNAGIGIKLVHGFGISQQIKETSSFGNYPDPNNPAQYTLKGNIDFLTEHAGADYMQENSNKEKNPLKFIFPAPAGKGIGFDIGLSGELINGARLALSVTDIGKIKWDRNVIESYNTRSVTITGDYSNLQDTLDNMVKGKTRPGTAFDTKLPTALRCGFSAEASDMPFLNFLPGKLVIAFDYLQGFNESLGNTTKPRFSLGTEYYVFPVLPIRSGLAFGGGDKVHWAFGFGFDFYNFSWDFATDNFGMFFIPKTFQTVSFSMGMKVRV